MKLPFFENAFRLLQTVPGIGQLSAATILAETGADLAAFPTAEKVASWAGLCPGNKESAGVQKGRNTKSESRNRGDAEGQIKERREIAEASLKPERLAKLRVA